MDLENRINIYDITQPLSNEEEKQKKECINLLKKIYKASELNTTDFSLIYDKLIHSVKILSKDGFSFDDILILFKSYFKNFCFSEIEETMIKKYYNKVDYNVDLYIFIDVIFEDIKPIKPIKSLYNMFTGE